MSPLYRRLLLWFLVANVFTLLVSVLITEQLARHARDHTPNWAALAQEASQVWLREGQAGLLAWQLRIRRRGIEAALLEEGRPLAGSPPPLPPRLLRRLLTTDEDVEWRSPGGQRVALYRVEGADGQRRELVARRRPQAPPSPRQLLGVQVVLSLLVIGLVGAWLSRSIAGPLAAIGAAARRVAGGDLGARVPAPLAAGPDEVAGLARDFNGMADRLAALVARERRVLQDLSHELRSPLARLQLLLDLARRGGADVAVHFERAEAEVARLDRLIGDALALSRLEGELPAAPGERLDLAALVARRLAAAQPEAERAAVQLALQAQQNVVLCGHPALLERAVDNLLTNAIKYNRAGARVEVTLRTEGEAALIRVRDDGAGVPPAELAQLFLPFFRGSNAAAAPGHGLGLALVARIARVHGGSASAENLPQGGLAVTLTLPLESASGGAGMPGASMS